MGVCACCCKCGVVDRAKDVSKISCRGVCVRLCVCAAVDRVCGACLFQGLSTQTTAAAEVCIYALF